MRKWYVVAGFAVGYVLGAKAGRERYDQIVDYTRRITGNDKVQHVASSMRTQANKAMDVAQDKVKGTKFGDIIENFTTSADEPPKKEPWDSAGVTTPARNDRALREDSAGF
ncbi:hypothetical protein LO763_20875 [Glycomyces sp. A-F 0318]|uniref:YtxH domain-containing protein n=1 Tax=Glycomyces amatae TaxID=2881355 RepID=UPI001E4DF468|nr:YtxH domain-containing protein [Glycomyces amatae]MCD0446070.1 hypothetical protein [Glycomyces amatae]